MTDSTTERKKLKRLNEQMASMEQQRDAKAKKWFDDLLSGHFVFRRASGAIVDKQTFLKSLDEANPFASRQSGEISVTVLGERALVTLIVRTTKADGTENRYRNIRLLSKDGQDWKLDLWYNYDLTSL